MLRWLAPALLLAAPVFAQPASFTRYGAACLAPPMVIEPSIGHLGLPHVGRSFAIDYVGIEGDIGTMRLMPVLLTGFAAAQTPIDPAYFPQQRPGCTIWLQPIASLAMPRDPNAPGQFVTRAWIALPRDLSLLGLTWRHQWLVYYLDCTSPTACTLEAVGATEAAVLQVGH